ncbi:MAG: FlgB family protein [Pseudomonadota bacterium]
MFDTLEIFDLATARARHAAAQQNVAARNIANADTPGYRAQATLPFDYYMRSAAPGGAMAGTDFSRVVEADTPMSPNGNSVSLEMEMVASVDAQRTHSRALTVYQSALTILRTSLGR